MIRHDDDPDDPDAEWRHSSAHRVQHDWIADKMALERERSSSRRKVRDGVAALVVGTALFSGFQLLYHLVVAPLLRILGHTGVIP